MRNLDFSSLHALLSTLLGLTLITLLGVGIRLLLMQTLQQRRERENRQINERLRALIAAYRTLGGSFTGNLVVDPAHLRDLRRASMAVASPQAGDVADMAANGLPSGRDPEGSERARRIRDAVESALADIILLGTEDQVRLAARAASEMTQGRLIHTSELVISLRDFIRSVLDLGPVPEDVSIPVQGPLRPSGGKAGKEDGRNGGQKGESTGGRGSGQGMGGGDGGAGSGAQIVSDTHRPDQDDAAQHQ